MTAMPPGSRTRCKCTGPTQESGLLDSFEYGVRGFKRIGARPGEIIPGMVIGTKGIKGASVVSRGLRQRGVAQQVLQDPDPLIRRD